MTFDPIAIVLGHERLTSTFKGWPSFHDAEVLSVQLDREGSTGPTALFRIRLTIEPKAVVSILFSGVEELEVYGFNNQNALFDMVIEPTSEGPGYSVAFEPSHGGGASFTCQSIEVVAVEA